MKSLNPTIQKLAGTHAERLAIHADTLQPHCFFAETDSGDNFEWVDNGWFKTGDLVKRDAEGYFYFISRKKDIIRRRGENIAGAELDRVIGNHPGVLEVAAIAVPSELGEDEILAAIVKRPDVEVTASDIAAHCREHLAPMKVPRYVLFVDSLPYTPTHKIAKAQLRADKTIKDRAVDLQPSK